MKTRALFQTALVALAAFTLSSCNLKQNLKEIKEMTKSEFRASHEYRDSEKWGKVVTKTFESADFTDITTYGAIDVVYTQDSAFSIKAYGNEKAIGEYEISIEGNTLSVGLKGYDGDENKVRVTQDTPAITLFISSPTLQKIDMYGAGDTKIEKGIDQTVDLSILIHGAGDINCGKMKVNNFLVQVDGAGDIDMSNVECQGNATFLINGAGDIDSKVKCGNATLTVNGAGDIDLNVDCNDLRAECHGAGDIDLSGKCNTFTKEDGAIGGIDSRNLKVANKTNIK